MDKVDLGSRRKLEWKMWELYEALVTGDVDLIQDLLNCGLDPHEEVRGSTPLVVAAWETHTEIVEMLLASGAIRIFTCPRTYRRCMPLTTSRSLND